MKKTLSHIILVSCFACPSFAQLKVNTNGNVAIRNEDNGIIAYLGASREGLGNRNKNNLGISEEYDGTFYKCLFKDSKGSKNFAEVVSNTKIAFINSCNINSGYRYCDKIQIFLRKN